MDIHHLLPAVPYFSGLAPADLQAVARAATCRVHPSGSAILLEGEPAAGLYLVESGWLKAVRLSTGGREQVLHWLGPGEVFNAVAVFSGSPCPASVIALEESRVWCIDRQSMLRLLQEHPPLAGQVIQDLAARLQHLAGLVEDLSLRSVESRLARILLEEFGPGATPRRKWATQTEMAARLGTVPDVLSRALRKLADEGLVSVSRRQVRVLDPEGLRRKIDPPQGRAPRPPAADFPPQNPT